MWGAQHSLVFSPPATTRLSDYPWGYLRKDGLCVWDKLAKGAKDQPSLKALEPSVPSYSSHLQVLRMRSRRGWVLGLSTPAFSQLPIVLPVVGPSWGPFHLSIEATTCPPFEGQSARLPSAARLSTPAWPGLTINAPKSPSSPPAPFP